MPPPHSPPRAAREPQRIAKLLARAGIASRREIERMIAEGRVAIAGKTLDTPATVLTSLDGVTVDGQPVAAPEAARLFRYHKPAGLLTAERDPMGRPTIYDRLPRDLPRVMPVGRLDLNTEGLLLLTTDGELKRQLELPSTGVERVYRARVFGEVSQAALEALIDGVEIEGVRYGSIDANMERRTGRNAWVEMRLAEGKNREVRRVLEHLGLKVSRLIRTAYGPLGLWDLPPGEVEEVLQHDLVAFRKDLRAPAPRPMGAGPAPRREGRAGASAGHAKPAVPRARPAIPGARPAAQRVPRIVAKEAAPGPARAPRPTGAAAKPGLARGSRPPGFGSKAEPRTPRPAGRGKAGAPGARPRPSGPRPPRTKR